MKKDNHTESLPRREWKANKKWNPFNSYKLLAHVDTWKHIQRGRIIPPPILITVDPTNVCNCNCEWCNAAYIRKRRTSAISRKTLMALADFLPTWEGAPHSNHKVEAICVAGGGEPLMNPATPEFIERVVSNGIEVGIVSNGTLFHECLHALSQCTWVGVSIDAGNADTFNKLKRVPPRKDYFNRVIDNIAMLVDYAGKSECKLGLNKPGYGVSYKYLLYKENIGEVYQAAKLAKEIGCKNIHFRPAGTSWDKIGTEEGITFSKDEIRMFNDQIEMAMALDDDHFGVYGVTHKFNSQFDALNNFSMCYSIFMTAVIMPPKSAASPVDSFVMGLCCDRRGDENLELGVDMVDTEDIRKLWGSGRHWELHDRIRVDLECPRCTYQPHNEIYEQVILKDSMTYKFI